MATLRLSKELYFTTSTIIDWMDVFTRPLYKHIIVDSLKYCQDSKGLEIYARFEYKYFQYAHSSYYSFYDY